MSVIKHIGDGQPTCIQRTDNFVFIARTSVIQLVKLIYENTIDTISSLDVGADISHFVVKDNYCYLATSEGLKIIDLTDPYKLKLIGSYDFIDPEKIVLYKNYAILVGGRLYQIVDVSNPSNPAGVVNNESKNLHLWNVTDVKITGDFLLISDTMIEADTRILIFDLHDINNPIELSEFIVSSFNPNVKIEPYNNFLYVKILDKVLVYDITNKSKPVKKYSYDLFLNSFDIFDGQFFSYGNWELLNYKISETGELTDSIKTSVKYRSAYDTKFCVTKKQLISYDSYGICFTDITDKLNAKNLLDIPVSSFLPGLVKLGSNVICSDYNNGLSTYNLNSNNVSRALSTGYLDDLKSLAVYKNYLYQLRDNVTIYKFTGFEKPDSAGLFIPADYFNYKDKLKISGTLLMFLGDVSLQMYSLKEPLTPQKINLPEKIIASDYEVNDTLLTAWADDFINVYSIKDINNIKKIISLKVETGVSKAFFRNGLLNIFWGSGFKIKIVDISDPSNPKVTAEKINNISGNGGHIIIVKNNKIYYDGMGIFRYWKIGVAEFDEQANAKEIASFSFRSNSVDMTVVNDTIVLSTYSSGIFLLQTDTNIISVNEKPERKISFLLKQNYPNPFNPETIIEYELPDQQHVTLKVYDMLGREAAFIVNEIQNRGMHTAVFDGRNFSSGVYFYRLETGSIVQIRKMILVK